jgi:uncharacterized BrkB/YihY/UPF0761 family membrane protein
VTDSAPPGEEADLEPGFINRTRKRFETYKSQAMERLESERARRPSVRMAFDFYRRDQAFAGSLLAGGLSVKLFLWFLPFALSVVVLIGTLADSFDEPASEVAQSSGLAAVLAKMVADAVAVSDRARWYLAILGIVLLLWTGTGVVRALRLTSRLAWRTSSVPPSNRLLGSLALIGLVVGILVLQGLRNRLLDGPWYVDVWTLIVAGLIIAAMFTVVFDRLPRPEGVPWTAMIPGAILMTVGILAIRLATIVYFGPRLESSSDLYGGLGLAATFLLWLYVISRTLVASISLNATIWQRNEMAENATLDPDSSTGI